MNVQEVRAQLERCHTASFGWALSCCARDPALAEEVLQTVYLKVLEGKARFDEKATFKTWLFAVIRKTAAEERRRRVVRKLRFLGFEEPEEQRAEDLEESIDSSELQAIFQRAFAALSRRQLEVLHLVFYEDFTLEEVAKVLGISIGAVRTHYERGKKRLRQRLEESEEFNEARLTGSVHGAGTSHRGVLSAAPTRG